MTMIPPPLDLVSAFDLLGDSVDAEKKLRSEASIEFAQGEQNGPMRVAHDKECARVIATCRAVVALADRRKP